MKVPFFDPTRELARLRPQLAQAVMGVLESGRYILGPEVEAFERECAQELGAGFAVGLSSGTDALLATLLALDIGPGDEVVCPTYTFFSTASTVARVGATPVFVDCGAQSFNLDLDAVIDAIGPRTRAVIVVHLFGDMVDVASLRRRLGEIPLIEDTAQAMGARRSGRAAGTVGSFGCYSFFPAKNLGGFGDGGLVTTQDANAAARVRRLRAHGAEQKYHHTELGGNFRLDPLQAALLRVKLPGLSAAVEARRRHAARYNQAWVDASIGSEEPTDRAPLVFPRISSGDPGGPEHAVNQYVLRIAENRDEIRHALKEAGIGTAVYYPKPLHSQPILSQYATASMPLAERYSGEALALPVYPELSESEQSFVIEKLIAAIRAHARERK